MSDFPRFHRLFYRIFGNQVPADVPAILEECSRHRVAPSDRSMVPSTLYKVWIFLRRYG